LLKNNRNQLPLKNTVQTLAVIGPHGAATTVMQGNYEGVAPYLISPLDGLKQYVPSVKYAQVCTRK
jgi:hypothetical protein